MSNKFTEKDDILDKIANIVDEYEEAIADHPQQTQAAYLKYRDAYIEGMLRGAAEGQYTEDALAVDQFMLVRRYILASSFIAAWYHLAGDKAKRDQTAHSCSTVISGLGFHPKNVMEDHIRAEATWRLVMKKSGIGARWSIATWLVIVVAVLAALSIAIVFLARWHG